MHIRMHIRSKQRQRPNSHTEFVQFRACCCHMTFGANFRKHFCVGRFGDFRVATKGLWICTFTSHWWPFCCSSDIPNTFSAEHILSLTLALPGMLFHQFLTSSVLFLRLTSSVSFRFPGPCPLTLQAQLLSSSSLHSFLLQHYSSAGTKYFFLAFFFFFPVYCIVSMRMQSLKFFWSLTLRCTSRSRTVSCSIGAQ